MPKRELPTDHRTFSNDEIMAIIQEIQADADTFKNKQLKYERMHPEFAEQLPMLFEMACSPNMDMQKLNYMLGMRASILNRQSTPEMASANVGQKFFDIYVKPLVNQLDSDKKKEDV